MTAYHWSEKKIAVDPDGLAATLRQFNEYFEADEDKDFERDPKTMSPIVNPPYTAIELCLISAYTTGEPKHDAKGRTLDTEDKPIPRLYSVGNLGDRDMIFPGGVAGTLSLGRVAAGHAVNLNPWDQS